MKQIHKDGIYMIDNFLSKEDCKSFIKYISKAEEQEKSRKFAEVCDFYNHKEINDELSQFFWNKLKDTIPKEYVDLKGKKWEPVKPSEYIATAHYKIGEKFNIHTDTGIHDKNDKTVKSKFTTLIYLNSNFRGGETVFFNEKFQETLTVKPKTGSLLMFDIDLWHSAMPIRKGEKYWMGLELMFKEMPSTLKTTNINTTLNTTTFKTITSKFGLSPLSINYPVKPQLRNTPLEDKLVGMKTGSQDIYLTSSENEDMEFSNPKGDQYDRTFKRYPKTVTKPFIAGPDGLVDFCRKFTFTIDSNKSDIMKDVFVNITLPKLDKFHRWVPYIGEALIKQVELEIGGQRIDRHTSEFLHVYGKLFLTDEEKKSYYKQIGHVAENYNKSNSDASWNESDEYELMIPLRFSFNRFMQNALPLASLYTHDLRINMEFRDINQLVECKSNCPHYHYKLDEENVTSSSMRTVFLKHTKDLYDETYFCKYKNDLHLSDSYGQLIIEGRHLDDDEYNRYRNDSLDMAMEQLQYTGEEIFEKEHLLKTNGISKVRLNFNHPVKELLFFCSKHNKDAIKRLQSINGYTDTEDATNILEMCNYIKNIKLSFNGRDHVETMPEKYFTVVQQGLHHTNQDDNIYCYSFADNPEEYQPSQSVNFSQIDNATLILKMKDNVEEDVYVSTFAINHSVLRFMSGMAGLAYSK